MSVIGEIVGAVLSNAFEVDLAKPGTRAFFWAVAILLGLMSVLSWTRHEPRAPIGYAACALAFAALTALGAWAERRDRRRAELLREA